MFISDSKNNRCLKCDIFRQANEQNGCCIWYMDNIVCDNKTSADCPEFEPIKESSTTRRS